MTTTTSTEPQDHADLIWNLLTTAGDDNGAWDWRDDALCAQVDPEAFYPDKGGSTAEAKAVCAACEVRDACLEYALTHDERFGIWGGKSERERRALRRARKNGGR